MKTLTKKPKRTITSPKPCVVCGHNIVQEEYAYHYQNLESTILSCLQCGHLFIHPVPLVKLDERTMDTIEDAEFSGNKFFQALHEKLVINREIRTVRKFLTTEKPRLLDIGCGTGWTTSLWQKNGFDVIGLEPSSSRAKKAQELYKINVSTEHIENFKSSELFDVVVMRHLLEHIEEPKDILNKARSFLKPDGVLIIVIPNIDCIGRHIFKENWAWILPWHLHFYTTRTLSLLLKNLGYKKLSVYQTPSPLWYPYSMNMAWGDRSNRGQIPQLLALLAATPIILFGMILNKNDNMTLIFRNQE